MLEVDVRKRLGGFELRAVDYVTKPFEPREFCARVRSALRTKRLLDLVPKPEGATCPAAAWGLASDKRQVSG